MSEVLMGRKKKAEKPTGEFSMVAVRCTSEWSDWVKEGAAHCRTDVSKMIDAALAVYLRTQGFPKSPPKRTP